jgi:predicted transposase/invertase (TIGR01784 family)
VYVKIPFKSPRLSGAIRREAKENAALGKSLNIMNDVVFKAVFTGDNEDSRKALKFILEGCTHRPISAVQVLNNEILPEHLKGKSARLDVHVTFNDGEKANLEMQMEKSDDDIKTRASIYGARLLSGQAQKGKNYRGIKRVYQIFFLNFNLFPGSIKLPRRYFTMEEEEHDKLNEKLEILFFELPKLDKIAGNYFSGECALATLPIELKWCMYLRYKVNERAVPLIEELCRQEEGIMRADQALKKISRDEEQWARALFREKAAMDYRFELYSSRENGLTEGIALGKAEEREKACQKELEAARKLKARGLSNEDISCILQISIEDIASFQ